MPVPMAIGRVRILVFPRSKSGIFDLTLNKIEHFSKVSTSSLTLRKISPFWMDTSYITKSLFLKGNLLRGIFPHFRRIGAGRNRDLSLPSAFVCRHNMCWKPITYWNTWVYAPYPGSREYSSLPISRLMKTGEGRTREGHKEGKTDFLRKLWADL